MTGSKRSFADVLDAEPSYINDVCLKKRRDSYSESQRADIAKEMVSRLAYPAPNLHPRSVVIQLPTQLLSFSYSEDHILEFTDAAMKYFVEPPIGADLSYRYDAWVKRQEERGRLDGLLEATLRKEAKWERQRANVVCWRGVMTKILTAPYEEREGFDLNVMLVNGTIYFEEHLTDAKLKEKENMAPRQRLQTYYGYAFESYCTSSTPTVDPSRPANGWGGDINTNVQWCSVAKTKIGEHRMIIGGEVDCVRDSHNGTLNTFVELKTSMNIRNGQDEARFEKKLLKFYFQSFLLGVPEIVVGFRTPSGHVTTLQGFKTIEIPRLVRSKPDAWDPNICLDWGSKFLGFVNSVVHSSVGVEKQLAGMTLEGASARVWRVRFEPRVGVQIGELDTQGIAEVRNGEDRVGFLPRHFWDAMIREGMPQKADSKPAIPAGWSIV